MRPMIDAPNPPKIHFGITTINHQSLVALLDDCRLRTVLIKLAFRRFRLRLKIIVFIMSSAKNNAQEEGGSTLWTRKCAAEILLTKMLKDGEVDPGERPVNVYNSNDEFKKYAPDVFRNHWNAIKRRLGMSGGMTTRKRSSLNGALL